MKELYTARFIEHIKAGDDNENARLRIIEEGCPVELAVEIDNEVGDEDEE